jgi:mannose-1-phosphate guanylyltransferase/phosphomannomutase
MMHLKDPGMIERTVVILCGGKGTRSADPGLPKALQKINQKSLISILLASLRLNSKYKIVFVAGWHGEKLIPEVEYEMNKYPNVGWKFVIEDAPRGTTRAVIDAIKEISSEEVMIVMGDLYINANLGSYFDIWNMMRSEVLLIGHPNNHPDDSDLVSYDTSTLSVRKLISKRRIASKTDGNMALAGITLIKRNILKLLSYNEVDLIDAIFSCKDNGLEIKILPIVDTVMDVGNPSRLAEVCKVDAVKTNTSFSALLLDLDGTLMPNQEIKNYSTTIDIDSRVLKSLVKINRKNIPIFIITNQPGIAKGFFSWLDFDSYRTQVESYLASHSIGISRWFVCPHHPDSGFNGEVSHLKINCDCRKPGTKFATVIEKFYKIDLLKSFMLGDCLSDAQFAKNAGINFQKVTLSEDLCNVETLTTWSALDLIVDKI